MVGPAAALLADARLEAAEARAELHVESQDESCNTQVHPEHCAFCRFLQTPLDLPLGERQSVAQAADVTSARGGSDAHLVATWRAGSLLPRAPPPLC
jgi:hypothetical protein